VPPTPLHQQVAVITGASGGIGRCTARYFAARGAKVVVTARREEALRDLVREIEDAGGEAIAVPGDVTVRDDMRRVAAAAVEHFGRIDSWINNAAVYIQGRVQDTTLDEYRRLLDVDVIGVINGTQCALEQMLPRGSGVIVQVSSIAAKRGVPYTSAYSAAKAAIDGFTESLRAELWGSGVRLSILYPPTVDTPIYQHARGKLGVLAKPAPPVEDPEKAAREIARLAESGRRYAYFGWARPLHVFNSITPRGGDWLLHRAKPLTYSSIPAGRDNLYSLSPELLPRVRGGWADPGWKGLTLKEAVRVFPVESILLGAAAGFVAGRAAVALLDIARFGETTGGSGPRRSDSAAFGSE
jgi:NAD(P)-dependent dehydrogenase (short-subunit alcohol dehydrogenase family)